MIVALVAVALFAWSAEAGVKCGDIISLRSGSNDRFWRTHRSDTTAISTAVDDAKNMYVIQCKWKSDRDPVTSGDVLFIRNLDSGEYLADGSEADHSAAMHNHVQTTLATVNASVVLSPLNEFTIFTYGKPAGLNDRSIVENGAQVSFRNRMTRFWIVPENSNAIVSKQFGKANPDKEASFEVEGFCPLVDNKPCNRNGKCEDNRCVCDRTHRGPSCAVAKTAAFCHAIGDGDFKSFDGVFFTAHSKGEFLMFSSPEGADKEAVTITMGTVKGAARPDVVQPVAVSFRKGGDIVTVGTDGVVTLNCGADINLAVKATAGSGFGTDAGLRIYSTDQLGKFEIRSESGVKVVAHSGPEGISVWVHIFEPRVGELKGMCGDFDGTAAKEMTVDETNAANKEAVDKWSLPEAQSFKGCGAESSVTFLEVAPAFTQIGKNKGMLTQLIVSKASVSKTAKTEMDRAKLTLNAAIHDACPKGKVSLAKAKVACKSLSVSSTAVGLNDYATCLSDTCLTGEASALKIIQAAKQDASEQHDAFEGEF